MDENYAQLTQRCLGERDQTRGNASDGAIKHDYEINKLSWIIIIITIRVRINCPTCSEEGIQMKFSPCVIGAVLLGQLIKRWGKKRREKASLWKVIFVLSCATSSLFIAWLNYTSFRGREHKNSCCVSRLCANSAPKKLDSFSTIFGEKIVFYLTFPDCSVRSHFSFFAVTHTHTGSQWKTSGPCLSCLLDSSEERAAASQPERSCVHVEWRILIF